MNIFTTVFIAFRRVLFYGMDEEDERDETNNLINDSYSDNDNNEDSDSDSDSDIETSNFVDFSFQSKMV